MDRKRNKLVAAAVTAACLFMGANAAALAAETTATDRASQILKQMTLDEKLGQMIWTHVYGSESGKVTPKQAASNQRVFGADVSTPSEAVKKWHLGGVLYFNWSDNIGNPADLAQLAKLSNGLQDAARANGAKVPLAISVDQEGGRVARLRHSTTDFPGNMALGATNSDELAEKQGRVMGRQLHAVGINVDFAPDVDVNTNPKNPVIGVRSLGSTALRVGQLGAAQIRGIQSQGVSATAKHFPGHGDTSSDSHSSLPVVAYGRDTLERHLLPFKDAIANDVDMIMTAHVVVNAIDPDKPATLSHKVLTDLLRGELGYKGIITTDAIDMEGAQLAVMSNTEKQHYAEWKCKGVTTVNATETNVAARQQQCVDLMKTIRSRVTVEAVKAGSDIVLNTYDVQASVDGLKTALAEGTLKQADIDASVRRILEWKARRGVLDAQNVDPAATANIKTAEDEAVANQIIDRSVTLVKNDHATLPLAKSSKVLVAGSSWGNPEILEPNLKELGYDTRLLKIAGREPTDAEIASTVKAAEAADVVVYTTYNAYQSEQQRKAVQALVEAGKPVIVVTTSVPYDSAAVPGSAVTLNVYGNQQPNLLGAARVIAGQINPTGQLPVDVLAIEGVKHSRALPAFFGMGTGPIEVNEDFHTQDAPFRDVPAAAPFADPIKWVKDAGITHGWPDGTFHPWEPITREAFAAFLARSLKTQMNPWDYANLTVERSEPFKDYATGPFTQEASLLRGLGIITGWSDGTFRPQEPITREAVAAMIARTCTTVPGVCSPAVQGLALPQAQGGAFKDVDAGNPFSAQIKWAKDAQITQGWSDGTFRPYEPVQRAAVAAFIYRALNNNSR